MTYDLSIGRGDNAPNLTWAMPFAVAGSDFDLVVIMPRLPIGQPSTVMTLTVSGGGLVLNTTANTVTWLVTTAQSAALPDTSFYTLRRIVPNGEVRYYAQGRIFGVDGPVSPSSVTVQGVGPQGVPGAIGPAGAQGEPGPAGGNGAPYIAGAVISGDKPLMFAGAGTVVHADPTSAGYIYAGMSINGAQPGGAVTAVTIGDVTADFWTWTPGLPVFAAPGGAITQSPPSSGRSHLIGWAVNAQTIHLDPDPVIPIH